MHDSDIPPATVVRLQFCVDHYSLRILLNLVTRSVPSIWVHRDFTKYYIVAKERCYDVCYNIYVCMVWPPHVYQSMDEPGKVANSARGQLNMENEYSPVPVHA